MSFSCACSTLSHASATPWIYSKFINHPHIVCDRCILDGKYQQAMGMAVECRRLDKLEEAITRSDNLHGALSYCINLSHQFVNHREYRCEVGSW